MKKLIITFCLLMMSVSGAFAKTVETNELVNRIAQQIKPYISTNYTYLDVMVQFANAVDNPATWAPGFSNRVTADIPAILLQKPLNLPPLTVAEEQTFAQMAQPNMSLQLHGTIQALRSEPMFSYKMTAEQVAKMK